MDAHVKEVAEKAELLAGHNKDLVKDQQEATDALAKALNSMKSSNAKLENTLDKLKSYVSSEETTEEHTHTDPVPVNKSGKTREESLAEKAEEAEEAEEADTPEEGDV